MGLQIVQIVASGTFGHVCVVRDTATDRLYAAKALRPDHLHNGKVLGRLRDEAAVLSRLRHPHIVGIREILDFDGQPVLLLEWVRGAPLDRVLDQTERGHLAAPDGLEIVWTAAQALHAAWTSIDPFSGRRMKVIHRDVKPSNLLLTVDGTLKVVDFGIAKGDFSGRESETVSVVLGADGYVAPERFDGAPDTIKGDIFALGCVAYELLAGDRIQVSLYREGYEAQLQRHLMRLKPDGFGLRATRRLTDLIAAMTAYDPSDRPEHLTVASEVMDLLRVVPWPADLPRLGAEAVVPLLAEQSVQRPDRHPAYPQLRFLEDATPSPDARESEGDRRLREFLADPRWSARSDRLRRILLEDPAWTAGPWSDLIDSMKRPGLGAWLFGPIHRGPERERMVFALKMAARRPDPSLAGRLRWLRRHRDPEIRHLAREIIDDTG